MKTTALIILIFSLIIINTIKNGSAQEARTKLIIVEGNSILFIPTFTGIHSDGETVIITTPGPITIISSTPTPR